MRYGRVWDTLSQQVENSIYALAGREFSHQLPRGILSYTTAGNDLLIRKQSNCPATDTLRERGREIYRHASSETNHLRQHDICWRGSAAQGGGGRENKTKKNELQLVFALKLKSN